MKSSSQSALEGEVYKARDTRLELADALDQAHRAKASFIET